METTQENKLSLQQRRNELKFCIIESWKTFAYNTKHFIKYLWLHLLIAGLGYALLSTLLCRFYTEHIQTTQAYIESGIDNTLSQALFAPEPTTYILLGVALVAYLFAYYLMKGAVFSQIRFYKATDALPATGPLSFRGEIKKDARKSFIFDLIFFFALLICLTPIILLATFVSPWWLLAAIPVVIYTSVIGTSGRLQYVVENQPLKQSLKHAFSVGHRKFGGYIILLLLTSIPVSAITYVALLPGTIIQLSYSADMISILAGDPSGIPPYVLAVYVVLATVGFSIFGIAFALQQWPLALYTSAVSKTVNQ